MKKLDWGTGIAIFYSVFAIAMMGLVIKSFDSPALVIKKNYYDDDINYQAHKVKVQNGAALAQDMTIEYVAEANTIILHFPQNQPAPIGKVTFFRPSKTDKDRSFDLKTDPSKRMFIRVDDFEKGLWIVQVEWQGEDKLYYKEEKINIEPNDWARPIHESK
jgi:nitrogen fixation protein FixH